MKKIAAVILAAGKGKRMNSRQRRGSQQAAKKVNKVVFSLGGKPMITYTADLLEELKISPIIVVVGFAKKSVMEVLKGRVIYAEQRKRLGTAHAVKCALKHLPKSISDALVLNGDDSAFYKKRTIRKLIETHKKNSPSITFLTIEVDNPFGLGRIVRDDRGKLVSIIENKDVIEEYKNIKEINPGCYIFDLKFLKRYIRRIDKSSISGEYYLTRLVEIAIKNKEKIATLESGRLPWRGINTIDELNKAEKMFVNYG